MRQMTEIEIDTIARAAHEVNRAYCMLLNDHSHAPWELAPEWQKVSARAGIIGVAVNEYTPEQSHQSWMQLKLAEGWKYGPVKDADKKEHPCMVEYKDLPFEHQHKDVLYTTTVKAMLNALLHIGNVQ